MRFIVNGNFRRRDVVERIFMISVLFSRIALTRIVNPVW
jgi:hypothetical protein